MLNTKQCMVKAETSNKLKQVKKVGLPKSVLGGIVVPPPTGSGNSSSTPVWEQPSPQQVTSTRKKHRGGGDTIDFTIERSLDKYEFPPCWLQQSYFEGVPL